MLTPARTSSFFLMIRRPPRSTLFPYTTALPICPPRRLGRALPGLAGHRHRLPYGHGDDRGRGARPRSEEHTSELQSRRDLVCRLLLEKKKKKKNDEHHLVKCATSLIVLVQNRDR